MRDTLRAIRTTLNSVEVRGKTNLDRMLACINALEQLEEAVSESGTEEKEEEHHGG